MERTHTLVFRGEQTAPQHLYSWIKILRNLEKILLLIKGYRKLFSVITYTGNILLIYKKAINKFLEISLVVNKANMKLSQKLLSVLDI